MTSTFHMRRLAWLKFFASVFVLGFCWSLTACEHNIITGCANDYYFDNDNPLVFGIFDKKTGVDILRIGQIGYNYDTLKIYNENWEAVYPYGEWEAWDGVIGLQIIDRRKDRDVLNQRISRRFYMYFNYQDVDTIDVAFAMRRDKCMHQVISFFKVAYNDSVYFNAPTDFVPNIHFLK